MKEKDTGREKMEDGSEVSPELRRLLNIEVPVIARIASKSMKVKEVLSLTVGSVIELDKSVEEPLDLLVNDQCIGRGETVRIGDKFGLHILELGPVGETIRKLGKGTSGPGDQGPAAGGASESDA